MVLAVPPILLFVCSVCCSCSFLDSARQHLPTLACACMLDPVQVQLTLNAVEHDAFRSIEGHLNFVKVGAVHTQSLCFYA